MEEIVNSKACLVNYHKSTQIGIFCIDKKCQEKSRILCQECLINKQLTHAFCDCFITFEDMKQNKTKLSYSESSNLKPIYDWIYQSEKELLEQVEKSYNKLQADIMEKISQIKKETKVKMMEASKTLKMEMREFVQRLDSLQDLGNLEEKIRQFNSSLISTEKLNEFVREKQNINFSLSEEKKLLELYENTLENHKIIEYDSRIFLKLSESIHKTLENYQLIPYPRKLKQLYLINGCDGAYRIDNYNKQIYIKTNGHGNYLNFQSEPFKRDEKVYFKFRLRNYTFGIQSKYFKAGVTTLKSLKEEKKYKFWFGKGNQISFDLDNFSTNGFTRRGRKRLSEVCYEGQIFVMEVCIRDNCIVLRDSDGECRMENLFDFNGENEEDWVIVLGDNKNQSVNFSIEVL